jgi:hypothetical protein
MKNQGDKPSGASVILWILRVSLWILALVFGLGYLNQRAWQPTPPKDLLDGTFLWIALGLYLLPFIRSIKLGKILELERELDRTREDTRAFKEETRSFMANVMAVATNVRATFNNYAYQGQEKNAPQVPQSPASISAKRNAMELKILNTLWVNQVNKFQDVLPRFTFKIDYFAYVPEAQAYEQAVRQLVLEGLIVQSTLNQHVFLTDAGLKYCLDHYPSWPRDIWFNQEALDQAKLKSIIPKIRGENSNTISKG